MGKDAGEVKTADVPVVVDKDKHVAPVKTDGERFAELMVKEFGAGNKLAITERERGLISGYFSGIARTLATAEAKRVSDNAYSEKQNAYSQGKDGAKSKYTKPTNELAYTWKNVDMASLASNLIPYARMGIDMTVKNHLSVIPYKSKAGDKYVMTFIDGYAGLEYIARKYALTPIKNVVTELVYSTDEFKIIKKDVDNPVESYRLNVQSPFARGEIVGGFSYIEYEDATKNKLVFMTRAQIEKRRPKTASAEFWGGMKTEWVWDDAAGKKKPVEVEVEGWFEEMAIKSVKRETFAENKHILINPDVIDDNFRQWKAAELRMAEYAVAEEIAENANKEVFDAPPPVATVRTVELPPPAKKPEVSVMPPAGDGEQGDLGF